ISITTPETVGVESRSQAIILQRLGLSVSGAYDLSSWVGLSEKTLSTGLSVMIDLSKISRFIKNPNITPTWALTLDQSDLSIPFRAHLNAGFQSANGNRYFNDSEVVTDFDRFGTNSYNSWALTGGVGFEFPLY